MKKSSREFGSTGVSRLSVGMKRVAACVWLGLSQHALGCGRQPATDDSSAASDQNAMGAPAQANASHATAASSPPAQGTTVAAAAGSQAATSSASAGSAAANITSAAAGSGGTAPPTVGGAGGAGAVSASASAGMSGSMAGMTGMAGTTAAAGAIAAAGAGATAGQAGSAQPTTVDDYRKPGPYQVLIEKNVGETFRNDTVYDDTARCDSFIAGASTPDSDPEVIRQLTTYPDDMDRGLYTLFRPEVLAEGKTYPFITWGNGTCSHPLLFEELLKHIASHGFIIIASNWRWVASGQEMLHGVDFILSENENTSSPLFGKIDTKMIGATGHSQGSGATVVVGADSRIVATVPIQGASASDVARLKGPTFLISGEVDMLVSPSSVESAFQSARVPAVYGMSMGQDHLMPGLMPAPILREITAWFKIHLSNDQLAREVFYGDKCAICSDPAWKVQRKNL